MNPIEFPEQNIVFGEGQQEYKPLPAHLSSDEHGQVVTVWEPSAEELMEIIRSKKIYLSQFTFGQKLQPILVSGHRSTFFEEPVRKEPSAAEKKTEANFHYHQTGGDNGPTGHGDDCLSDADSGL